MRQAGIVAAAALGLMTTGAMGQLITKVPEAQPRTTDFTPPAPQAPTPPPPTPTIKTVKAPDLIKKDEKGVIIRHTEPLEEVALRMIDAELDAAKAGLRTQVKAERSVKYRQQIAANPKDALSLRALLPTIPDLTDIKPLVDARSNSMNTVLMKKSMSEMMESVGAITPQARKAVQDGVEAYTNAIVKEALERAPGKSDFNRNGLIIAKVMVPRSCFEFTREFDALLDALAVKFPDLRPGMAPELADAKNELAKLDIAKSPADVRNALAAVLDKMPEEARKKLLTMVVPPMPTNPVLPPEQTMGK